MSEKKTEISILELPETTNTKTESQIIRSALEEERNTREALIMLRARDRRIEYLERKIKQLEKGVDGDSVAVSNSSKLLFENFSSIDESSKETTYPSVSNGEETNSQVFSDEIIFQSDKKNLDKIERKEIRRRENNFENSMESKESKMSNNLDVSNSKLSEKLVQNSKKEAIFLKNVDPNFNESSSMISDELNRDESSVNLVVTAALAFSKFDDVEWSSNDWAKVSPEKRVVNDRENKKHSTSKSSGRNFASTRLSKSQAGIKTRLFRKCRKRGNEKKFEKTRDDVSPSKNLREVQTGLVKSTEKVWEIPKEDSSKSKLCNPTSNVQKEKVEDKMVKKNVQDAAFISDQFFKMPVKIASTQTCNDSINEFDNSIKITDGIQSKKYFNDQNEISKLWTTMDEPAPQWLIEEALKRGDQMSEVNESVEINNINGNNEKNISATINHEAIIDDLEKQLLITKEDLAEALNEQINIKNKYKNLLKDLKMAADERQEELQTKLVKICTAMLEKFGSDALNNKKLIKPCRKRHQRPLQNFGKLSKKMQRKLKNASLKSSFLEKEIETTKKELHEKSKMYDSLMQCFSNLKIELKDTQLKMNDLINENLTLQKNMEDAREWMETKVGKDRHEKINAAQFREIQRSRELSNLKKKSEEDLATIAQLRGKLNRLECANSNKGFLLNNYKNQLADLTKNKELLSDKIKELENDNNSLRNINVQLRANLALLNNEKEKFVTGSEKLQMDIKEQMQSEIALKYERSMRQKLDTMKMEYDKNIEALEIKLRIAENKIVEYRAAVERFLKKIYEYNGKIDAERDLSCSEASEREAHETACEILNITPGELTGFLKGNLSDTIHSWLSSFQKITMKKCFAKNLGQFLFEKAVAGTKN